MALSFPSSPTLNQTTTTGGQTWTWNGNNWYVSTSGGGGASVTVANSAPTSPTDGSLWLNSDSGVFSVFYNTSNVWLGFVGGGSSGGGTSLPSFTGNTGKFLTNDGVYSSWGNVTIPSVTASAVSDQLNTSTGYFSLPTGNTAQRPGTPVTGATRINSQTNYFETYYNSNWFNLTYIGLVTASSTNSTVTYSGNYAIHTFITSGTFTPTSVPVGGTVDYLVVAGGGGGGRYGGGGGAGGLIYATSQAVASGTSYVVTVGGGAPGWPGDAQSGGNAAPGINSTISAINVTAYGGGGGGLYGNPTGGNGANGGSGGGGGGSNGGATAGGTATVGQGNAGGTSSNQASNNGGGGGGAGAAGTSGVSSSGAGGIGAPYTISGTSTYYAGGGSGNQLSGTLAGGLGGGGTGFAAGVTGTTAMDGTANTGGGGGGARDNTISGVWRAGNGGSGIVIIRYRYQ